MRTPGYQALFALLAEPDVIAQSQRAIATLAGTSRQPVADLLARLVAERLAVRRGRSHEWVGDARRQLFDRWISGYRYHLAPGLEAGRFRVPASTPREIEQWLSERAGHVRYGGTAGAYRLVRHYRGPTTMAHLGENTESVRRRIKAVPAADGPLAWMRDLGEMGSRGVTDDTVHPLLLYAQLDADPDPRAAESAARIRKQYLPWSLP